LRIRGHAPGQGLTVLVVPIPDASITFQDIHGAVGLVLVIDPRRSPPGHSDAILATFGLSPAEVRLVLELLKGTSLRAALEKFAISPNTAKTQLKAVYAKTGCRRYGDLVRTIAMLSLASAVS